MRIKVVVINNIVWSITVKLRFVKHTRIFSKRYQLFQIKLTRSIYSLTFRDFGIQILLFIIINYLLYKMLLRKMAMTVNKIKED